jgi:hypothetical protein
VRAIAQITLKKMNVLRTCGRNDGAKRPKFLSV